MFFIQYTPHLIACISSVTRVLSTSQLQDSANPGMRLSQEGDLNIPSLNQGDLIEPDIIAPSPEFALVPFDENGGLTDVIQSFPSFPQLNIFPQGGSPDPEIPPDIQKNPPTEREEPDCRDKKFAFCCQQGPPARGPNKTGILSHKVLLERARERKSRLRDCRKWSKDDPVCSIPENEACCTCLSKRQSAFFCYNPHGITSPPRLIRPDLPNPSPSEPDIPGATEKKRDLIDNNSGEDLFAAAKPSTPDWKRPGGRTRFAWTCSDEFLENLGLGAGRHHKPSIHTPENPFQRKPNKKIPDSEGGWDDGYDSNGDFNSE